MSKLYAKPLFVESVFERMRTRKPPGKALNRLIWPVRVDPSTPHVSSVKTHLATANNIYPIQYSRQLYAWFVIKSRVPYSYKTQFSLSLHLQHQLRHVPSLNRRPYQRGSTSD